MKPQVRAWEFDLQPPHTYTLHVHLSCRKFLPRKSAAVCRNFSRPPLIRQQADESKKIIWSAKNHDFPSQIPPLHCSHLREVIDAVKFTPEQQLNHKIPFSPLSSASLSTPQRVQLKIWSFHVIFTPKEIVCGFTWISLEFGFALDYVDQKISFTPSPKSTSIIVWPFGVIDGPEKFDLELIRIQSSSVVPTDFGLYYGLK